MKSKAIVPTEKGARYMKALVNHFSRKVEASYAENQGSISFGFGRCEIEAGADALVFIAESEAQPQLERLEGVIDSHLKRFMQDDAVTLEWEALEPAPTN